MKDPVLTLLRKMVKSRMNAKKNLKPRSLEAAVHFNKWLSCWGNKCTEKGARGMVEKYKDKFMELLPGKSHNSHDKWMKEVNELKLLK